MNTVKCLGIAVAVALGMSNNCAADPLAQKLEDNYSVFAFGERKKEPDFVIVAGAREYQGRVAVCGLVFFLPDGLSWRYSEPKATKKVNFSIGGTKLAVQTGTFRRYRTEAEAINGDAGCALTNLPWLPVYATTPLVMEAGRVVVTES